VEPSSSPSLVSSPNTQETAQSHCTGPTAIGTGPDVTHWQWHDVYRWVLQLHGGQFVKYNKSLYDGLCAQNITGSKLGDLTPTDWLVLGITDSFDIQAITRQIGTLRISPSSSSSLPDSVSEGVPRGASYGADCAANPNQSANVNDPNHPNHSQKALGMAMNAVNPINAIQCTQTQTNNMWIINGNVVGHNMMNGVNGQSAFNESTLSLFVHQTQQQLNVEHNKRLLAESALAELQSKSGSHVKALEEALSHCVQQYHAMAALSGSLQNEARAKEQELAAIKGEHGRLMAEYEGKVDQLELEMAARAQMEGQADALKRRYHEMYGAMQRRQSDLESKYSDLESRYNALEDQVDHLRRFRRWDFNEVYLWIIGIDDGYFGRKYVDLYDHLEIQQVSGNGLADFGVDEIAGIGIEDVVDQRRLLANIRVLLQNGSDGTTATDSQDDLELDYAAIDLLHSESI